MSVTLAQPTVIDLLRICRDARPDEIAQYEALVGLKWDAERVAVDHYNRPGLKCVLLDDNEPKCAAGLDEILPGVWHAWMVGTMTHWETHWRSITKYTRRIMTAVLDDGARRIQAGVLSSREKTCEWYVRGLKMEFEGHLRGYGAHGETMDMYARVRE